MWLPAKSMPSLAKHLKTLTEPQAQESIKPKKKPLVGTLGQIALLSMDNATGLITWLIAKSWAVGREDYVNALVPQLQAAVDSLKGADSPDASLIESISKGLKEESVAWLKDIKKADVYLTRLLADDGRQDTISKLAREVNSLWTPPNLRATNLRSFATLFPDADTKWLQRAKMRIEEYRRDMAKANAPLLAYKAKGELPPRHIQEGCSKRTKEVLEYYSQLLRRCSPEQRQEAVAAFWQAKHTTNSVDQTSASICFLLGIEEICKQLKTLRLNRIDLLLSSKKHGVFTDYPLDHQWQGEKVPMKLCPIKEKGGSIYAITEDLKSLGCLNLSATPPILLDVWFEGIVHTRYSATNQPLKLEVFVSDDF